MNVNVRIPFTLAQREELETQTVIYKYIMACLPVPQQLLLSITNNPSNGKSFLLLLHSFSCLHNFVLLCLSLFYMM